MKKHRVNLERNVGETFYRSLPFLIEDVKVTTENVAEKTFDKLTNCYGVIQDEFALFMADPILSKGQIKEIETLSNYAYTKMRAAHSLLPKDKINRTVLLQLAQHDKNWREIRKQHFVSLGKTYLGHFPFYMDLFYDMPLNKRLVGIAPSDFITLVHFEFFEVIAKYCSWLSDEAEAFIETFPPDEFGIYELEWRLKDYRHEASSNLITFVMKDISNTIYELSEIEQGIQNKMSYEARKAVVKKEKELYLYRKELGQKISILLPMIKLMQKALDPLKREREIFERFYHLTQLFSSLVITLVDEKNKSLPNSVKTLLIIQLINELLNVVFILNSEENYGRSNWTFSLMLAMDQLKETAAFDQRINLVLNWEEINKTLLQNQSKNNNYISASEKLIVKLKELFLENLITFEKSSETFDRVSADFKLNQHMLSVVPLRDQNDKDLISIAEDGNISMTDYGYQILTPRLV